MAATTGYQAGYEANQASISFGAEAVWGTPPATTFQALRFTSEGLRGQKNRSRPGEIRQDRQASAAITTQESAGGPVSFALSYGTYDDFIASVLCAEWSAVATISGAAADISTVASGNKLTSTNASKFAAIPVGAWIKLGGFASNSKFVRVAAKNSNQDLTLAGATVTDETPTGTNAKVTYSHIQNGSIAKTLFLQRQFASSSFFTYPGSYAASAQLSSRMGEFLNGSFTMISRQEVKALTDSSTGGVVPAPAGRVHDPVAGFKGVYWNDALIDAVVDQASFNLANDGAAMVYGLGNAAAQGLLLGTFGASAQIRMYFRTFDLYDAFKAETDGRLAVHTADNLGNRYILGLPLANLMNPQINAGGPGQAVMATFDVEGNPDPVTGATFTADRIAYTA